MKRHVLARVDDYHCICKRCLRSWMGEKGVHKPFGKRIKYSEVEDGERKCYGTLGVADRRRTDPDAEIERRKDA